MKLYCLSSSLHDETRSEVVRDPFIRSFAESLAEELIFADDFADYDSRDSIIYIRTGGTEGLFKSVFCPHGETVIPGGAPVRLLASGQSNSLAASMEILSWLEQQGLEGLILHGDTASPNPLPKEEVINRAVYTPLSVSMVFTPPFGSPVIGGRKRHRARATSNISLAVFIFHSSFFIFSFFFSYFCSGKAPRRNSKSSNSK